MALRCLRRGCPWSLAPGELFCGLCGQPAATCTFEPASVQQGLIFYPDQPGGSDRRFTLRNTGRVPVDVTLRCSDGYRVRVSGGPPLGEVTTRLPPDDVRPLEVLPRPGMAGRDEALEVISPVLPDGAVRVPLVASAAPRWALHHGERPLDSRDGLPADLYPPAVGGGVDRWRLHLGTTEGAVLVDGVVLGEGAEHLQLLTPPGRHLLQPGDRLPLTLDWIVPPVDAVDASLEVIHEELPVARFPLKVHPQPPIALRARLLSDGDRPLFVGGRPALVRFALENQGAKAARLERVTVEPASVRLAEVALEDTAWDCRGLSGLPRAVEAAYIQGPEPRLRVDPRQGVPGRPVPIRSLTLEIAPDAEPVDGVLTVRLDLEVWVGDARDRAPVTLAVPARRIRELSPDEGRLLLDFGTVHTCARLEVDDLTLAGAEQAGAVPLEPGAEGEGQQLFKSAYRVDLWKPADGDAPRLRFGHHVWEELPHFVDQTDHEAKLRLGTDRRRALRDRQGYLRMVDGVEATSHLLGEVLARVSEGHGFRPRALWLTRPAAFRAAADRDLTAAVKRLGFEGLEVSLRCTEPEAYLCALAADPGFLRPLDARLAAHADGRPELGFVFDFGGGTTDVTLFQASRPRGRALEIVTSHGYRWLGGEALTLAIAAHLFESVGQPGRFPFPELGEGPTGTLKMADPDDEPMQRNVAALRALAERLKCDPTPLLAGPVVLSEVLVDSAGHAQPVEIRVDEAGLVGVVRRMVDHALDDVLERVVRLRSFRLIERSVPGIVAVAGNSGRLWCLERIVRDKLAEAGVAEPLYHFDAAIAKRGVVDGLAVYGRSATRVGIELRDADPHWWYLQVGPVWQLIQPAGGWRRPREGHEPVPALDEPVHLWGALELAVGEGPQGAVPAAEAGPLEPTHRVHPGALDGELAELALGFDAQGAVGLWLRPWADGGAPVAWRFVRAEARRGGRRPTARR
ncbi:MAG: hypothetical protein KC613_25215 [Myxococcales bacterium]|nr:hypothetical protein [Myxococcales bacterium]